MTATALQNNWKRYLSTFSKENQGRRTRIGVFEPANVPIAVYWLESGLPLESVNIDVRNPAPSIEIRVGSLTHQVKSVISFAFRFSIAGDEDGLDVIDQDGRTTVLRFET